MSISTDFQIKNGELIKYLGTGGEVTVPEGIKKIGHAAFMGCTALTGITIPKTVDTIGTNAFEGCTALTSVEIPATVKKIQNKAFLGCSSLCKLTVCNGVSEIGIGAFEECRSLKHVIIPPGVKKLSYRLFARCNLSTVELKGSPAITDSAFTEGNNSLKIISDDSALLLNAPDKHPYILGYVHRFSRGEDLSDLSATYDKYIKRQRKKLMSEIGENAEFYSYLISKKLIPYLEIADLITTVSSPIIRAMLLNYQNEERTDKNVEKQQRALMRKMELSSGAIPTVAEAKKEWLFEKNEDGTYKICRYRGDSTIVTVPERIGKTAVTVLDGYTFEKNVTAVTVPVGITTVNRAFYYAEDLKEVTFPETVTYIRPSTFTRCKNLETITVHEDNPNYCTADGVLYSKDKKTLICCPAAKSLTEFTVPDTVRVIEDHAFCKCRSITKITLPKGIKKLGEYAFSGCEALTEINLPEGLTEIKKYCFYDCFALTDPSLPSELTKLENGTFGNCASIKVLNLPDRITEIGDGAFYGCIKLLTVNVPNSVTALKDYTFHDCRSLTEIKLPDSIAAIGLEAFCGYSNLLSINIPEGITELKSGAFEDCTSLKTVNIPNTVTSIGISTFKNCIGLTDITMPESLESIEISAFYGCSGITTLNIPKGVARIGANAFGNCASLREITVAEDTQKYLSRDGVLYTKNGTTLITYPAGKTDTEFKIPDGVTTVQGYAFSGCRFIKKVTVPSGVCELNIGVFRDCPFLTEVHLPKTLTRILTGAFTGTSIPSITVPESVVYIESNAFTPNTVLKVKAGSLSEKPAKKHGFNFEIIN